jgi:hypothetical protein
MPAITSLTTFDVYKSISFQSKREPIYYFSSVPPSVTEESSPAATFVVTTIGVPESSILYWRINHITTDVIDFVENSGSTTVNSSRTASFNISTTLQPSAEGDKSFSVIVSLTPGGPAVATSGIVTLIDLIVPTLTDLFSAEYYQGLPTNITITNGINLLGSGGAVWTKQRDFASAHVWYDTVLSQVNANGKRRLMSLDLGTTRVEAPAANVITFNSDGYTMAPQGVGESSNYAINVNGRFYHSWVFRKEPKFFDIVPYVGNGATQVQTIAHNLQSVPGLIFVTEQLATDGQEIATLPLWHRSYPSIFEGKIVTNYQPGISNNKTHMLLSTTDQPVINGTVFANTVPTSTHFSVSSGTTNQSGQSYVAYLFGHNQQVFAKSAGTGRTHVSFCGYYEGQGAGQQIDCGFTSGAQFLIIRFFIAGNSFSSGSPWYFFERNQRGLGGFTNDYYTIDSSNAILPLNDALTYYAPGFGIGTGAVDQIARPGYSYIFFAIGE